MGGGRKDSKKKKMRKIGRWKRRGWWKMRMKEKGK